MVGHLTIVAADGLPGAVSFQGDRIVLEIPDVATARAWRRKLTHERRRAGLQRTLGILTGAGLELVVTPGGRPFGRLAAGGRLASWLGVEPQEPRVGPVAAVRAGRLARVERRGPVPPLRMERSQ